MYMYICFYIYIYIYIDIYTYMYIYISTYACICMYIHTYIHTSIHACMHACIHTHRYMHVCMCAHTHIDSTCVYMDGCLSGGRLSLSLHVCMNVCKLYIYIHTHTCHTGVLSSGPFVSLPTIKPDRAWCLKSSIPKPR